ncbi:MAG: type IV pilus secretin PilQ [Candidatus Binatia bacterium]
MRGFTVLGLMALLSARASPPAALDEEAPRERAAVESSENVTNVSVAEAPPADADVLVIRELKIIDDNGQQGVFAKLNRPPQDVSHVLLSNPTWLLIEIAGPTGQNVLAERYAVDEPDGVGGAGRQRPGQDPPHPRSAATRRRSTRSTTRRTPWSPSSASRAAPTSRCARRSSSRSAPCPASPPRRPRWPWCAGRAAAGARGAAAAGADRARAAARGRGGRALPAVQVNTEASANPRPRRLYYGQPISLDLKDADVHNVIRLLGDVSGINIVATDVTGQVTLRLNDVPWDQALDIVMQAQNLESVQDGNVLRVSTVRRLREEREEQQKAQRAAQTVEPLQVAYLQVNYAKAKKLADLISGAARSQLQTQGRGGGKSDSDEEYGVLSRRGSVMVDEFTNTLIVRDIERGIRNARDLVTRLDVQIPQVLIESNIVEATSDFARDLGVQWGYKANIGPQTGTSTGANFPGTVNFGGSGLGGSNGVPFLVDFPAKGNFGPGTGTALDLALGSLNGANSLDVRLTALEQKGKGRIISRPRVVTLNNVAATIQSLTILRVRLPSTGTVVNTGAGGSAGTATTATEKIETGITLEVTPQVSSDGFVLLDMFAKSSQADFTRTVDNIPTEITRQATSHVLVRDGQTVVLGGIYRDTQTDNVNGVPWFMEIPGIKWLFQAQSTNKRREDLLVFLTPRVLHTASGAALPTAQQLWEKRDDSGGYGAGSGYGGNG